jgi:hypothetical protein
VGDTVFANNNSILHAGSAGKAAACLSPQLNPPTPPAGPVPAPLPNTAMASDLDKGAKSVLIEGNPAGHVDSEISKSMGDEPALPPPTFAGVISHRKNAKATFVMHSMDVMVEGNPVVRHLDTTLHDCAATPNTPPWVAIAAMEFAPGGECDGQPEKCKMVPFRPKSNCPDGKTGHHLVQAHSFVKEGENAAGVRWRSINERVSATAAERRASCNPGAKNYKSRDAPTVCVTGKDHAETGPGGNLLQHGRIATRQAVPEAVAARTRGSWTYGEARDAGCEAAEEVLKPCTAACFKAQLDAYHMADPPDGPGIKEDQEVPAKVLDGSSETADKIIANQAKTKQLF